MLLSTLLEYLHIHTDQDIENPKFLHIKITRNISKYAPVLKRVMIIHEDLSMVLLANHRRITLTPTRYHQPVLFVYFMLDTYPVPNVAGTWLKYSDICLAT